MRYPAPIAALLLATTPAAVAAADLQHRASGITVPEAIGDMRRGDERDASGGKSLDLIVQYGSATEPVTIYIYRGAFPNPALWFERTRHAMKTNVGLDTNAVAPRSFTFGGAAAPNGLREESDLSSDGPWKATAVAMAQAGEWMLKARVTSQTLDRQGVARKMDRLLGAIRLAGSPAKVLPLIVPAGCESKADYDGKPVAQASEKQLAGAMLTGTAGLAMSRGHHGLAADPNAWCREESQFPPNQVSIYRERSGRSWVALIGDAGRAVMGLTLEPASDADGSAVLSSSPMSVQVVSLFDGPPPPEPSVMASLGVVTGAQRGMIEIGMDPPNR